MPTLFGKQPSAIPGVAEPEVMDEQASAIMLTVPQRIIGENEIKEAAETLAKYKQGKANLENRIVQDEMWYEMRHWEAIRGEQRRNNDKDKRASSPEPSSAWLFNAIANKHADAMDNFPEPVVLPREQSDEDSAKILSSILPVVMEYNDFEDEYSDNWWEKLKHGTAAYGVFWNADKENGLGDIDIRGIDLLKIFWEPGITDIQKSRNLFIVDLVDDDILEEQFPETKGKQKGSVIDVKQYIYDDTVDTSTKSVVVDWYYKRKMPNGRTILHYCKFVGSTLLYASENDPAYQTKGFYDHGLYPVVFDCLFPEKGTPVGFGYVAICKDPQLYIDKLSANILESSMMATKKRFFVGSNTNVNTEEFKDWNNPLVRVEGDLSDTRLKEIVVQPLDATYLNVVQQKVEEMKDTASNRDVNSGGYGSGVTAAAAISALQEAGNKVSRDMIAAAYRKYVDIAQLVIELMRQFYDEKRAFRIMAPGSGDDYEFITMDNSSIVDQPVGMDPVSGAPLFRKPVFDLKIRAQKKNPFSRMEQNELAKELYSMGFFNPEKAQESMLALDLMEFEGIDQTKEKVAQGQTLLNLCQQLMLENASLKQIVTAATGQPVVGGVNPVDMSGNASGGNIPQEAPKTSANSLANAVMQAQTPMSGYGQRLAARSTPNINVTNPATNPGGRA